MPEGGYTKRYTNRGDRGVIGLVGERWSLPRFQAGLLITPQSAYLYDPCSAPLNMARSAIKSDGFVGIVPRYAIMTSSLHEYTTALSVPNWRSKLKYRFEF